MACQAEQRRPFYDLDHFRKLRTFAEEPDWTLMDPLLIAILCFILAIILAAADLLLPSGGVLVISSILAALACIYFAFRSSVAAGTAMIVLILVAIPIFLVVAIRVWPHTPFGRRVILKAPMLAKSSSPQNDPLEQLVGQVGVAQNSLIPSGHVRINHHNYNARSELGIIEAGQPVEVVAVKQRELIVVFSKRPPETKPLEVEDGQLNPGESLLDRPAEELGLDSLDG